MKLEIEITEEEIKSAIERKVRIAIADQTNQWNTDSYIKAKVAEHWKIAVDKLVLDALGDSETIKTKIKDEFGKKIRSQVNKLIKAT